LEVVAGLSLKNLKPRVWDKTSPFFLSNLRAIMVSYADFVRMPARRRDAMEQGLRTWLGAPPNISVYLDNGAFFLLGKEGHTSRQEYEEFVQKAQPDWYAIPQDYIPTPRMSDDEQLDFLRRTMEVNRDYQHDGFVPVIHISRHLDIYLQEFLGNEQLRSKPKVALGGIVPNLLRTQKAMSYAAVLDSLYQARKGLDSKQLHVFGLGGTATVHLAALLRIDSADSSGWRNRAARGIVQLPGRGDRMVANLGNWRGREPNTEEWGLLTLCLCPVCQQTGVRGLKARGIDGFCNRATHNLWTLLDETCQVTEHLNQNTYDEWYGAHLDNSTYRPLIEHVLFQRNSGLIV
jgi:hypothetical protein